MSGPLETRCPTCGADLPITPGSRVATCKFCQKDVVVEASTTASPSDHLVTLARAAAEAGNDEEASELWSRVLETDPRNSEAWLGKARAVTFTLATMGSKYAQAESYCERAIESAADKDDVTSEAFAALTSHLESMAKAAESHFDEFSSVGGAAGEFVENVFGVLDAYDRVASITSTKTAHLFAIQLCDKLLDRLKHLGMRKGDLVDEIQRRRREHLEKGGAPIAAALEGAGDGADDNQLSSDARRRLSISQMMLLGVVLILVVLSIAGFGRWTGSSNTVVAATPGVPSTPPSPAVTDTAPATTTPATPASVARSTPTSRPSSSSGSPARAAIPKAKPSVACDTGCIKGTDPSGNPTWIGGNGGGGLPCCGELAEAKAAKPPTTAACDSTCWYNGRCQVLMSGSSGLACCKPIKDEFGCSSK